MVYHVVHLINNLNSLMCTYMPQNSRFYKDSSEFHSILRKLCDSSDQSFLEESSCLNFPSNTAPDPLLSTFMWNFPMADELEVTPLESSNRETMTDKLSDEKVVER